MHRRARKPSYYGTFPSEKSLHARAHPKTRRKTSYENCETNRLLQRKNQSSYGLRQSLEKIRKSSQLTRRINKTPRRGPQNRSGRPSSMVPYSILPRWHSRAQSRKQDRPCWLREKPWQNRTATQSPHPRKALDKTAHAVPLPWPPNLHSKKPKMPKVPHL